MLWPSQLDMQTTNAKAITWGVANKGGDSRQLCLQVFLRAFSLEPALKSCLSCAPRSVQEHLHNVLQLRATSWAFAALKSDGTVLSWGDPESGGDCRKVHHRLTSVCQLCACAEAFAALTRLGQVVTWGHVLCQRSSSDGSLNDVQRMSASSRAFAALKKDGTVVTWGDRHKSESLTV